MSTLNTVTPLKLHSACTGTVPFLVFGCSRVSYLKQTTVSTIYHNVRSGMSWYCVLAYPAYLVQKAGRHVKGVNLLKSAWCRPVNAGGLEYHP